MALERLRRSGRILLEVNDELHLKYKRETKREVIAFLVVVSLSYALFNFPDALLNEVASRASQPMRLLLKLAGTASLLGAFTLYFFASDSLFQGTSKATRFLRGLFPSNAAQAALGCASAEAAQLWFKYFDTWGYPKSPNHAMLKIMYRRTYAARMIFYLQRLLVAFCLLAGAMLAIEAFVFRSFTGEGGTRLLITRLVFPVVYLVWFFFLGWQNRIAARGRPATGVWSKVQEIFERGAVQFKHDVLDRAGCVKSAFERIEAIREALSQPAGLQPPEPLPPPGPSLSAPA